jgi:hypothetical protein
MLKQIPPNQRRENNIKEETQDQINLRNNKIHFKEKGRMWRQSDNCQEEMERIELIDYLKLFNNGKENKCTNVSSKSFQFKVLVI